MLDASYLARRSFDRSHPHGYFTWILEAAPPLIAAAIWAVAHERFRLTPL
jgi:hypothetical protein